MSHEKTLASVSQNSDCEPAADAQPVLPAVIWLTVNPCHSCSLFSCVTSDACCVYASHRQWMLRGWQLKSCDRTTWGFKWKHEKKRNRRRSSEKSGLRLPLNELWTSSARCRCRTMEIRRRENGWLPKFLSLRFGGHRIEERNREWRVCEVRVSSRLMIFSSPLVPAVIHCFPFFHQNLLLSSFPNFFPDENRRSVIFITRSFRPDEKGERKRFPNVPVYCETRRPKARKKTILF